jgi:murein DD-endopeptidase MepM/ murein hydrolase activator NlpD
MGTFAFSGQLTQGGWIRGVVPKGTQALRLGAANLPFASDGRFFAAFDRDAGPQAQLTAVLASGLQVSLPLTIAPRAWDIERVNVGKRPGEAPSAEYERRRAPELARINAARALSSDSQGWRQAFVWPVIGRISGRFGSQRIYRGEPGAYHSGLDIATGESGTSFVAPADGVVILAADEPFTLEGHLLMIDHGMGLNSAFLHCSQLLVKEGDVVRQGQVIGRIGMTGRATGPHLHWSIKWRDRRLDPLLFTGPMH